MLYPLLALTLLRGIKGKAKLDFEEPVPYTETVRLLPSMQIQKKPTELLIHLASFTLP